MGDDELGVETHVFVSCLECACAYSDGDVFCCSVPVVYELRHPVEFSGIKYGVMDEIVDKVTCVGIDDNERVDLLSIEAIDV